MKNALWFVILLGVIVFIAPAWAAAQSCGGMYTYYDMWVDDSGTAVAINYSEGDAGCGSYNAYASITVTMPSGSSQWASASGTPFAESLAQLLGSGEEGDGSLETSSEVDYSCGNSLTSTAFSVFPIQGAHTIAQTYSCQAHTESNSSTSYLTNACTLATSPPTCSMNGSTVTSTTGTICPGAWQGNFTAIRLFGWRCYSNIRNNPLFPPGIVPYLGPLPGDCTKLP